MKLFSSRQRTHLRVCRTESDTSSESRSTEGHALPFEPANCVSRENTSFSEGRRSGDRRIWLGTSAPSNRLNALKISPMVRHSAARRSSPGRLPLSMSIASALLPGPLPSGALLALTVLNGTASPRSFRRAVRFEARLWLLGRSAEWV